MGKSQTTKSNPPAKDKLRRSKPKSRKRLAEVFDIAIESPDITLDTDGDGQFLDYEDVIAVGARVGRLTASPAARSRLRALASEWPVECRKRNHGIDLPMPRPGENTSLAGRCYFLALCHDAGHDGEKLNPWVDNPDAIEGAVYAGYLAREMNVNGRCIAGDLYQIPKSRKTIIAAWIKQVEELLVSSMPLNGHDKAASFTVAVVLEMTGISDMTLNKYAKLARVTTPDTGKRNHRYTKLEVQKILNTIIRECSARKIRDKCARALNQL